MERKKGSEPEEDLLTIWWGGEGPRSSQKKGGCLSAPSHTYFGKRTKREKGRVGEVDKQGEIERGVQLFRISSFLMGEDLEGEEKKERGTICGFEEEEAILTEDLSQRKESHQGASLEREKRGTDLGDLS